MPIISLDLIGVMSELRLEMMELLRRQGMAFNQGITANNDIILLN